jgi:hypothetical protein
VTEDHAAAIGELWQAIAGDILATPELSDPAWDTYSLVAEVSDDDCATTAYRYAGSGPPVSTGEPDNVDLYWDLRDRTAGADGAKWDVALLKIHRDTGRLVMSFLSGEAADRWRITPANMCHLPESMRPVSEDFA